MTVVDIAFGVVLCFYHLPQRASEEWYGAILAPVDLEITPQPTSNIRKTAQRPAIFIVCFLKWVTKFVCTLI